MNKDEHPYVKLARKTIEQYTAAREIPDINDLTDADFNKKTGVFVSIKKGGDLRGCIGTIVPTEENIALEIIRNAISASHQDPRFPAVREDELDMLDISVDVLEEAEIIDSIDDLNPDIYGVIVEKGFRRGLLLPDLEGVDTAEKQVAIACRKAGISPSENIKLSRFKVERYY